MSFNPANGVSALNNPTQRANKLNDPQYENKQGYYPYDLTHSEYFTQRYGEAIPAMVLDTVPADRTVVHHNIKTIHNQINGNFLSTVNQYLDTFYVPLRSLYPMNYEKLIPNPTKGMDLPNSALPQVPFSMFVNNFLTSEEVVSLYGLDEMENPVRVEDSLKSLMFHPLYDAQYLGDWTTMERQLRNNFALGRMYLISTILSRGQLLDALGVQFDLDLNSYNSLLQEKIDAFHSSLWQFAWNFSYIDDIDNFDTAGRRMASVSLVDSVTNQLTSNDFNAIDNLNLSRDWHDISEYRDCLSDILERGDMPWFFIDGNSFDASYGYAQDLINSYTELYQFLLRLFDHPYDDATDLIREVNASSNPFDGHFINISKPLAYQQIIAQYFTNNTVDNIFTSELYMQLLRATMFPSMEDYTYEPTFLYNGVTTEYDYISCGAFYRSLIEGRQPGVINRQYVYCTLMFLLRRSLRYGDYFATARPRMLAVGDDKIMINVEGGGVSPIDVTRNLLMQRYLNAVNYIGSGFLQYFASIYGVTPSDTGTFPRFIAHHKVMLNSQLTNNTADNQGAQTTNLVGYADSNAFDVFIDDLGIIMSLSTYDVLPVYTSGVDATYRLSDRFDYFNPMLQNIGDQAIFKSEIFGNPLLARQPFGYCMRNGELKFKVSRAHGGFCNDRNLRSWLMTYPLHRYDFKGDFKIDPEFIRDKPIFFDRVVKSATGTSPANYYHFVVATVNEVKCARKIQATPPVLF